MNKTPKEIDAVQCPFRQKTNGSVKLLGGEYQAFITSLFLGKMR